MCCWPGENWPKAGCCLQVDVLATLQRGAWINMLGLGSTLIGLQVSPAASTHDKKWRCFHRDVCHPGPSPPNAQCARGL